MFLKRNRVDKKTIEHVFKDGRFYSSANLTFKYIVKKDQKETRVSFIVPKTVSKKATDRNLLKRRGYAVLKKYLKTLPCSVVGVVIFNKKALNVFGGRKNKTKNPIKNLDEEIKVILNKF